jgi:hypothetical protein
LGRLWGATWTDVRGREFEAEFVRLSGDEAVFALANGRMFATPLAELSPAARLQIAAGTAAGGGHAVTPGGGVAGGMAANLGRAWPREVRMDGGSAVRVIAENRELGRYVYESPSYRFTCDARLTDDALRNFAVTFESVHKYCRALPLGLNGGALRGGRLDIQLFETREAYQKAGGGAGGDGCYVPGLGVVLVPLDSLGLARGGTGFRRDDARRNHVLIHELTHQLTPRAYTQPGVLGWFSEGVADYVAVTPYVWGRFSPDLHGGVVKSFVTGTGPGGTGGRALGTRLHAPRLQRFCLLPYDQFAGRNATFNYGFALLLVHYLFHMEGEGRARRVTTFLAALHAGRPGPEALAELLGGGDGAALEADMAEKWRRLGVEIRFGGGG